MSRRQILVSSEKFTENRLKKIGICQKKLNTIFVKGRFHLCVDVA